MTARRTILADAPRRPLPAPLRPAMLAFTRDLAIAAAREDEDEAMRDIYALLDRITERQVD